MAEERRVSWRDRYPEEVTCVRCLEVRPTDDLDRLLWCPDCRTRAARRAVWRGWAGGAALAGLLAAWIFLVVRPDRELILGGWIATIVAALWIGSRVVRELAYGIERYRNRRAVEAVPPAIPPEDASPEEEAPGVGGDAADGGDRVDPRGGSYGDDDRPDEPPGGKGPTRG